jgi:hypothetical protein
MFFAQHRAIPCLSALVGKSRCMSEGLVRPHTPYDGSLGSIKLDSEISAQHKHTVIGCCLRNLPLQPRFY